MNISEILAKALTTTLLGMGTVFALLIVISVIISCLKYIPQLLDRISEKNTQTNIPEKIQKQVCEQVYEDNNAEAGKRIIAVITAAIAAYEAEHGTVGGDEYIVKNIRRIKPSR